MKGNKQTRLRTILAAIMFIVISGYTLIYTAIAASSKVVHTDKVNNKISVSVEKYVNYNVEEQKGSILQLNVQTGIEYDEGEEYVPLQATGILLNVPKLNNEFPESVDVVEKSTKATNGSSEGKNVKYVYDKETGELKIATYNLEENGKTYTEFVKDARDSYSVILNYGENCYTQEQEKQELEIKGMVQTKLATEQDTKIQNDFDEKIEIEKDVSNLISNNVTTSDIYNGFIKINAKNDTDYVTDYRESLEINISKKELGEKTTVEVSNNFAKDDEKVDTKDIIYKTSLINKANVLDILGQEGYLKILNEKGESLGEINKDTEVDESGNYKLDYKNEETKLFVEFSKAQKVGNIKIASAKQIKAEVKDTELNKIQVTSKIKSVKKEIVKVENTNENTVQQNQTEENKTETKEIEKEVYNYTQTKDIKIKESKTEVELKLDNSNWTNEKQNKVNFNVVLHATESKNNLFKNPTVDIKLPKETQKVILDKASIVHGNGLKLVSTKYNKETKTISVVLEGIQKEYLNKNLTNGTNITIPATIILNQNIENKDSKVEYAYTNDATLENGKGSTKILLKNFKQESKETNTTPVAKAAKVKSVAKTVGDTVTPPTVEGISMKVTPKRGDAELTEGSTVYEGEFIKYEITLTNTTDKTLNDVKVIGTVPDGTTYGKLVREDNKPEVESYYDYDKNLKNAEISVGNMEAGKSTSVYYEVRVNDLADGETTKNISSKVAAYIGEGVSANFAMTNKVEKAEYKLSLSSQVYRSKEFIYTVSFDGKVKNGDEIKIQFPKCLNIDYISTSMLEITDTSSNNLVTIKATSVAEEVADRFTFDIYATVIENKIDKKLNEASVEIYAYATYNDKYKSNENRINLQYRNISISMTSDTDGEKIKVGEEINYKIKITNIGRINYDDGNEDYVQISVTDKLSQFLKDINMSYNYFLRNVETQKIYETSETVDIKPTVELYEDTPKETKPNVNFTTLLPYGKTITINIKAKAGEVVNEQVISNQATVSEEVLKFNYNDRNIEADAEIGIRNSEYIYHTIVPNTSSDNDEETTDENNTSDEGQGKDELEENNTNDEKQNEDKTTEENNANDEKQNEDKTTEENTTNEGNLSPKDNKTDNEILQKYSISGIVWEDGNGDGKRQDSEKRIKDVTVYLAKVNGDVVSTQNTTANGTYSFTGLEENNYIVVFRYDEKQYKITKYKASSVSEKVNSDASSQDSTVNNESFTAGVTDIINLKSSVSNIDLGLVKNKKFDFKVESYITNISVENSNGKKDISYNNTNLAKTEIKSKELDGTKVKVTYKILITNNGDLDGKVTKLIDSLPTGFTLDSTSSGTWAKDTDGKLVNTSITNQTIDAGRSLEISLVATISMTGNTVGTFSNKVEIENTTNELNQAETSKQNNSSKTDVILSISTGTWIYISICIVLLILILVVLNIKFNIFKNMKIRFLSLIFILGIMFVGYSNVFNSVNADDINIRNNYATDSKWFFCWSGTRSNTQDINSDARWRTATYKGTDNKYYFYLHGNTKIYIGDSLYYIIVNLDASKQQSITFRQSNGFQGTITLHTQGVDTSITKIYKDSSYNKEMNGTEYNVNTCGDFWYNYYNKKSGTITNENGSATYAVKDKNGQAIGIRGAGDEFKIPLDWRAFHMYQSSADELNNVTYDSARIDAVCLDRGKEPGGSWETDNNVIKGNSELLRWGTLSTGWRYGYAQHTWTYDSSNISSCLSDIYYDSTGANPQSSTNEDTELSVTSSNSNTTLNMIKDGDNYKFGPVNIQTNYDAGNYKFYIYYVNDSSQDWGYEVDSIDRAKSGNGYSDAYVSISGSKLNRLAEEAGNKQIKIKVQATLAGQSSSALVESFSAKMIYRGPSNIQSVRKEEPDYFYRYKDTTTPPSSIKVSWSLKGSAVIRKKDEFTGKSGNVVTDLSGIKFKLKTSKTGNYVSINGKSEFTTGSAGYTEEIVGLTPNTNYYVYETYIPDRFSKYYDISSKINKLCKKSNGDECVIKIGYGDFAYKNSNGVFTANVYQPVNRRDKTNLEVQKKDEDGNPLAGIKLKILDVTDTNNKRWVLKEKDNNDYHGLSTNTSYSTAVSPSNTTYTGVFVTDNNGKVYINNIEVYDDDEERKFEVYEIGFDTGYSGYHKLYELGEFTFNNRKRTGKKIGEFTISASAPGKYTHYDINHQDYGSLQVIKEEEKNEKPLQGIGFKIKVNGGSWLEINSSHEVTSTGKTYANATTVYTNSKGEIDTIYKLPIGKYYDIYEVYIPENLRDTFAIKQDGDKLIYDARTTLANAKCLASEVALVKGVNQDSSGKYTIPKLTSQKTGNKTLGSLRIEKKETKTKTPLNGIGFKIRARSSQSSTGGKWVKLDSNNRFKEFTDFSDATQITTDTYGKTDIINALPVDGYKYYIYETFIPTHLREYFVLYESNGIPHYEATDGEHAWLISDEDGITLEHDLRRGTDGGWVTPYKPIIKEISGTNDQTWIKLSGRVWEDGKVGKDERAINNEYGGSDYNIKGVTVRLVDNSGNVVSYKDINGITHSQSVTTDDFGNYLFEKVKLSLLDTYHIEFSYDGITYQALNRVDSGLTERKTINRGTQYEKPINIPNAKTSKASESSSDRSSLNSTFTRITGNNTQTMRYKNSSITLGYAGAKDGNNQYIVHSTNTCKYRWTRTEPANSNSIGKVVINSNNKGDFQVASTISSNYLNTCKNSMYKNGGYKNNQNTLLTVIPNLNLGLYQREEADLGLSKDLALTQVEINGKKYTYNFEQDITDKINTQLGVTVENKHTPNKYSSAIHQADIEYLHNSSNKTGELKVYAVYTIALTNNSGLYGKINEIKEYYSKDLKFDTKAIDIYSDKNCTNKLQGVTVTVGNNYSGNLFGETVSDYNVLTVKLGNNVVLAPRAGSNSNSVKKIYIKFELPKASFYDFTNHKLYADKEFRNYAEISSYTNYSSYNTTTNTGTTYAHFDYDSVPQTITKAVPTTQTGLKPVEDDSSRARGLQLELSSNREITGYAFLDNSQEKEVDGVKIQIGNGIKQGSEKGIEGLTVQLVPISETGISKNTATPEAFSKINDIPTVQQMKKYYRDRNLNVSGVSQLTVKTDKTGKFTIKGFIPGEYQVRYFRNNFKGERIKVDGNNLDALEYKSTIYNSAQTSGTTVKNWYLSDKQRTNYSEAVDTWTDRKKVDENLKINYDDLQINSKDKESIPTSADGYMLNSWTRPMEFGVELTGTKMNANENGEIKTVYGISSIDFGLVARPTQQLKVEKSLKKIRIIDGQDRTVVDAEVIEENGKKTFKNLKEVLYTVILPGSNTNASGTVKSELDKDYLPAKLETTYEVTATDIGAQDYFNENFYYYGTAKANWKQNPITLKPSGIYDYISQEYDVTGTQYNTIANEEYNKVVHENIQGDNLLGADENSTKTVIEYGYEKNQNGWTIEGKGWKSEYKTLESLYTKWWNAQYTTATQARKSKLDGKKVLELTKLEGEYKAGETKTCTYTATAVITTEQQGISLDNDVEIINVDRGHKYGNVRIPTYKTLYDSGESTTVTPPTGTNNEIVYTEETNYLAISIASALAILALGIFLLKRFIINKK